jgi:hypothetical protein
MRVSQIVMIEHRKSGYRSLIITWPASARGTKVGGEPTPKLKGGDGDETIRSDRSALDQQRHGGGSMNKIEGSTRNACLTNWRVPAVGTNRGEFLLTG